MNTEKCNATQRLDPLELHGIQFKRQLNCARMELGAVLHAAYLQPYSTILFQVPSSTSRELQVMLTTMPFNYTRTFLIVAKPLAICRLEPCFTHYGSS